MKHTPGPWQIKTFEYQGGPGNKTDRQYYVESVPLKKKGWVGNIISVQHEADARLIAATPDLLWLVERAQAIRAASGWTKDEIARSWEQWQQEANKVLVEARTA